jgi:hypothetical protein
MGTRYSGWQFQTNARTVAGEIMEAIHRATGQRVIEVYGSGRTDAGVHAIHQVAHIDLAKAGGSGRTACACRERRAPGRHQPAEGGTGARGLPRAPLGDGADLSLPDLDAAALSTSPWCGG